MQRHSFNDDNFLWDVNGDKGRLKSERKPTSKGGREREGKVVPQKNRRNVLKLSVYGLRLRYREKFTVLTMGHKPSTKAPQKLLHPNEHALSYKRVQL